MIIVESSIFILFGFFFYKSFFKVFVVFWDLDNTSKIEDFIKDKKGNVFYTFFEFTENMGAYAAYNVVSFLRS